MNLPRPAKGAAHPAARLTTYQVKRIRQEYVRYRQPFRLFATRYRVHVSTIFRVVHGYTYFDDEG